MKFESLREQVYNKSQIHSVQMLRGIACLAVYFVHFFSEQKLLPASKLLVKASEYGYLGVQVFFVISGFIIPLSMLEISMILKILEISSKGDSFELNYHMWLLLRY